MTQSQHLNGLTLLVDDDSEWIIWHVSTGIQDPDTGNRVRATPTGAWKLRKQDCDLRSLTFGRIVLRDSKVEIQDLANEVREIQRELQDSFDQQARLDRKKRVRPDWPSIPNVSMELDVTSMSDMADLARTAALVLACWDETERQRIRRDFLALHGGPTLRQLPPRWSQLHTIVSADAVT